jgi:hypothetical protein
LTLTPLALRVLLDGKSVDEASATAPNTRAYFECINKVRVAAKSCIEKAAANFDRNLYALALAFHMAKLNGLQIWDRSAKIKLLACLLASCARLGTL